MSYKVKTTTLQLLNGAKSLADIGHYEEAYSNLSSLYAHVKGEIEGRYIIPHVHEEVRRINITVTQMDTLMTYYHKIIEADTLRSQRYYLNMIGRIITEITGDPSFFNEFPPKKITQVKKTKPYTLEIDQAINSIKEEMSTKIKYGRLSEEVETPVYSTGEAAEIIGVSSETIRRMCEKGKFPEAEKTDGGHWRIPRKYFKLSLEEAREADQFMQTMDQKTKEQLGENIDDLEFDIDRT